MKNTVYISIGSNLSNGAEHIENAFGFLRDNYENVVCSTIYSTPSISIGDDSIYFNAVASCEVDCVESTNIDLKTYESRCGRIRGMKDVVIDMDIVIADGQILRPRDYDREYFQIGYNKIIQSNNI